MIQAGPVAILKKRALYHTPCGFELDIVGFLSLAKNNPFAPLFPSQGPVFIELDFQCLKGFSAFCSLRRGLGLGEIKMHLLPCPQSFYGMMLLNGAQPQLPFLLSQSKPDEKL